MKTHRPVTASSPFRFVIVLTSFAVGIGMLGCDISSDPLPAFAFIHEPDAEQTLTTGEPFRFYARVEAENVVDSMIVHVQPVASGAVPLRLHVNVPSALRRHDQNGNLNAVMDTLLTIDSRPLDDVLKHHISLRTYVKNGRVGESQSIEVRLVRPGED